MTDTVETITTDLAEHRDGLPRQIIAAEIAFAYEVMPQVATAALTALVNQGVLKVIRRTVSGNVYAAAR